MQRLGREPRMQRVDPEHRGTARAGGGGDRGKTAEVAHAPIIGAAQPIKLAGQTPAARARLELRRQMAAGGGDDQLELRRLAPSLERQLVITQGQSRRQRQCAAPRRRSVLDSRAAGALRAVFEAARPGDFAGSRRAAELDLRVRVFGVNEVNRRGAEGCGALELLDFGRGPRRVGREPERAGQRHQRLVRSLAQLAQRVGELRLDADQSGEANQCLMIGHDAAVDAGADRKKLALVGLPGAAEE